MKLWRASDARLTQFIERTSAAIEPVLEAALHAAFPERVAPGVAEFLGDEWDASIPVRAVLLRLGSAAAGGRFAGSVVTASVAVEMVQLATLVIDDVLDGADMRSGRSCPATFGSGRAITIGEILKSRASSILISSVGRTPSRRSHMEALMLFEGMYETVNRGQFLDLSSESSSRISEAQYFATIRTGTGAFLRNAIGLGLALAAAPAHLRRPLETYGECLGMALQLYDDILDLLPLTQPIKPFAGDLKRGKQRLPLLHFLRTATSSQRREVLTMLRNDSLGDRKARRIVEMMIGRGSLAYTFHQAKCFENAAVQSLGLRLRRDERGLFIDLARDIGPDFEGYVDWPSLRRTPSEVLGI